MFSVSFDENLAVLPSALYIIVASVVGDLGYLVNEVFGL